MAAESPRGAEPKGTAADAGTAESAEVTAENGDVAAGADTPRDTPGEPEIEKSSDADPETSSDSAVRTERPSGASAAEAGDPAGGKKRTPADRARGALRRIDARGRAARSWALARRHPIFSVIIATAALLRLVVMVGYQPAMFFNDSFDYLHVAMGLYPHPLRPDGYSFLLWALKPFHSFALVAAVQHLMGLSMGVMIYALLRRKFGLPGWGAALATVPVLFDAYQIQLEHLVLSDTTFTFLVMLAVTLLLWHDRPSWKIALAVGLIVGFSWLTRSVGAPVLLGVLVYMLIRRTGWRMMLITAMACALPVLSYMTWYKVDSGKFAITESNGIFLYARVYKFADCHKMHGLPVSEYPLCTEPANRLPNSQDGIWNASSPLNRFPGTRFSPENNKLSNDFAKRAILGQPGAYLKVVAHDFFRVFRWDRTVFPDKATYSQYEFGKKGNALPDWRMDADSTASGEARGYEHGDARTRVIEPFAGVVRGYQDAIYLRGTMLGGVLLLGLGGMVALWRRFGGEALLPWTLATGLLLAPAATAEFDYRYVLPGVPLAALAAGMAFTPEVRHRLDGWWRRLRGRPGPAGNLEVPSEPVGRKVPEVTAR
ncbi:hypothetical protein [Actinomadura sp. NTSP31]|uniref:hypothetical protein n=1 Tax=Actinomadura sp. NTSP31 TaxID=1735447 RepID=UPI0035C0EB09